MGVQGMKRAILLFLPILLFAGAVLLWAYPSVFPHGTTIYYPEKSYNGYTIFCVDNFGAFLIDMRGNVVHHWENIGAVDHPVKLMPGGHIMGATGK